MNRHGINPLSSSVGQASQSLQHKLVQVAPISPRYGALLASAPVRSRVSRSRPRPSRARAAVVRVPAAPAARPVRARRAGRCSRRCRCGSWRSTCGRWSSTAASGRAPTASSSSIRCSTWPGSRPPRTTCWSSNLFVLRADAVRLLPAGGRDLGRDHGARASPRGCRCCCGSRSRWSARSCAIRAYAHRTVAGLWQRRAVLALGLFFGSLQRRLRARSGSSAT